MPDCNTVLCCTDSDEIAEVRKGYSKYSNRGGAIRIDEIAEIDSEDERNVLCEVENAVQFRLSFSHCGRCWRCCGHVNLDANTKAYCFGLPELSFTGSLYTRDDMGDAELIYSGSCQHPPR